MVFHLPPHAVDPLDHRKLPLTRAVLVDGCGPGQQHLPDTELESEQLRAGKGDEGLARLLGGWGAGQPRQSHAVARNLLPPGGNVPQMLTSIRCISHCGPRSTIYCRKGWTPCG